MAKARRQSNDSNVSVDSLIARIAALEAETPQFFIHEASTAITAFVTPIRFNILQKDNKGGVNMSTGQYIIQEAGDYWFQGQVYANGSAYHIHLYKNGVQYAQGIKGDTVGASSMQIFLPDLIVGDVIELRMDSSLTPSITTPRLHRFSGWKVK